MKNILMVTGLAFGLVIMPVSAQRGGASKQQRNAPGAPGMYANGGGQSRSQANRPSINPVREQDRIRDRNRDQNRDQNGDQSPNRDRNRDRDRSGSSSTRPQ
jgi:hypothetical protein